MKKVLAIFSVVIFISSCGSDDKVEEKEMSICECYEWDKKISINEVDLLSKSSDVIAKSEKEREEWNLKCKLKMNPGKMSEKKRLLEELQKCKK